MDPHRFDDLTRALGTGLSRRRAMKSLAGALLGGMLAGRARSAGADEIGPVQPVGRPLLCPAGKHCGDVCCSATETCVGLNQPKGLPGDSSDPNDLLECICQSNYVRDRTGACVCPAAKTCGANCCDDGEACCDGRCVDLMHSKTDCGACGHLCEGDTVCRDGACGCPPDTLDCGGLCIPEVFPNGMRGCMPRRFDSVL